MYANPTMKRRGKQEANQGDLFHFREEWQDGRVVNELHLEHSSSQSCVQLQLLEALVIYFCGLAGLF